jgi:hypothetical protein
MTNNYLEYYWFIVDVNFMLFFALENFYEIFFLCVIYWVGKPGNVVWLEFLMIQLWGLIDRTLTRFFFLLSILSTGHHHHTHQAINTIVHIMFPEIVSDTLVGQQMMVSHTIYHQWHHQRQRRINRCGNELWRGWKCLISIWTGTCIWHSVNRVGE